MRPTLLLLSLQMLAPSIAISGSPDATPGTDITWQAAEADSQYPARYNDRFIDSLLSVKNAPMTVGLRSVNTPHIAKEEKLVFDVGCGPMRAGYAFLSQKTDSASGITTIVGKGATNSLFSGFYRVRDLYMTAIDAAGLYPFFYEQHIREGNYKANRWELYDQKNSAVLTSKKKTPRVAAPPFTQNVLSLVYYFRSLQFAPGDSFSLDCFVDTKCHTIIIHCLKRETITVGAGEFRCLLLQPVLMGKGRVFSKKDRILIWVTDDDNKIPVMLESKISWGTLFARLSWYRINS